MRAGGSPAWGSPPADWPSTAHCTWLSPPIPSDRFRANSLPSSPPDKIPHARPPQIRSCFRFAATAQPAQPGRHRARCAASRRCRRDPEAGRIAARLRQSAGPRQGRCGAQIGAARRRIARRLHPRRRHRGRGRPPHPAQGQSGRRSLAMPAAAVGPQPPRLHRDLPGDAEGDAFASA